MSHPDWTCCAACGCQNFGEIRYPGSAQTQLRFDVIRQCKQCGFGQATPIPTQQQLDAFYRSGAYWHGTGDNPSQHAHESVQAMLRVHHCLPHLPRSHSIRVLDIGAGHGCIADWLARMLPGSVASYSFVEPDRKQATHIGHKRPGFALHAMEELPSEGQYGLIFLNHVLEHVADPQEFLMRVTALLAPAGLAYIETPHLDFRFKDDVFPHTLFFTPAAFEALGNRLPIKTVACESFGIWPGTLRGISTNAHHWLARLFTFAVKAKWVTLQIWADQKIWRYNITGDGVWLRWLIRRDTAKPAHARPSHTQE